MALGVLGGLRPGAADRRTEGARFAPPVDGRLAREVVVRVGHRLALVAGEQKE
ncbi:MAG: hypothetical protein VYE68_10095 [Acidobacteriota bacterium]|nr:hypothetical protein [Acidobacteriota bacterium]